MSQTIAAYPTTPASTVAATVCATRSEVSVALSTSLISKTAAPRIAGTASSKLKPTAHGFRKPSKRPAAIVSPLRLTPGSGANACAMPIRSASSQVISRGPLSPPGSRNVSASIAAVIKKPTPVTVKLVRACSISFLKKRASGMSGSVATNPSSPTRNTFARWNSGGTSVALSRNPRVPLITADR